MRPEERLFAALSGTDPALLERSEKQQRQRRWLPMAGLAAAACLVLVATMALQPLYGLPASPAEGADGAAPPTEDMTHSGDAPMEPEAPTHGGETGDAGAEVIQLNGFDEGTLHLAQLHYDPQAPSAPDFVIYVNEEAYHAAEEDGAYVIRYNMELPEDFPPVDLTIVHRPGVPMAEAAEQEKGQLADGYEQVFADIAKSDKGYTFTLGDDPRYWDSPVVDVTCVPDRQGGSFVLTARYFIEATEGHGSWFSDMVNTFQVVTNDDKLRAPDWMNDLRDTIDQLMDAYFADSMEDVVDLMTEDAWAGTYGEDVSRWISVSAVDYRPDNDRDPTSAVVSVRHRMSAEEPYNYLTMELVRRDGQWLLTFAGLEK